MKSPVRGPVKPIFEIGFWRALATLAIALVLTICFYELINAVAVGRIQEGLGIGDGASLCGEAPEQDLQLTDLPARKVPDALEKHFFPEESARSEDHGPKVLWARVCHGLQALPEMSGNPLHVGVTDSEQGTDEACTNFLSSPEENQRINAAEDCESKERNEHRFAWLPLVDLKHRVLGVELSDASWWARLGRLKTVRQKAVQGTVYRYDASRVLSRAGGPRERRQLEVLSDFDKVLNRALNELEEDAGVPRWLLRNLNGGFQWGILACGLWGILLLGQLWLQAYWQGKAVSRGQGLYRQFAEDCQTRPANEVTEQYFRWLSHSSSILVDWIIEIIPLLGFIGTVVGMILAMSSVSGVVASDPGPELVSAMARVSDSLSLAFSTTFVALALSILLYLLRPAVHRAQEMVVDTLPGVLVRRQGQPPEEED